MNTRIFYLLVICILIIYLRECASSSMRKSDPEYYDLSPDPEELARIRTMAKGIAKRIRSRPKTSAQARAEKEEQSRSIQNEVNSQYINLAKIDELQHRISQINKYHAELTDRRLYRQRKRRMERLRRFSKRLRL